LPKLPKIPNGDPRNLPPSWLPLVRGSIALPSLSATDWPGVPSHQTAPDRDFAAYARDPHGYCRDILSLIPWRGTPDAPGQAEVLDAYAAALTAQLDGVRDGVRRIRVESGHGIGKTRLAAAITSHFFDCFPSIVYTFAPTYEQINDLLFKEIRRDRRTHSLPGRALDTPEVKLSEDRFIKGRATSDAAGRGSERIQGQHHPYLLFVLDEAEGVAEFVYDAVDSMASGGVAIVLMLANPRTRTSRFHTAAARPDTVSLRVSSLSHPNVIAGEPIIPGAVERPYIDALIADGHAEPVAEHNADRLTIELPWRPGVIYAPTPFFQWRVMGIAPTSVADNTLCPVGRYHAARARQATSDRPHVARIGVDCARWGSDSGTIYARHDGSAYRVARLDQQDTHAYVRAVRDEALRLVVRGVTDLAIRVDGGGGFGGGIIDALRRDADLQRAFRAYRVFEVLNNAAPHDPAAYDDLGTEMYAATAEALRSLALADVPPSLEQDICERRYDWVQVKDHEVKRLESKKLFRKRAGRSPDDGDGLALACAPDHLFRPRAPGGLAQGRAKDRRAS
jgi:hypothetical protein